jgi:hypothetical protein
MARVVDEDRHSDQVSQTATGSLQGLIEKREYGTNLRVKVPGDRLMVEVFGRDLTCQREERPARDTCLSAFSILKANPLKCG